MSRKHGPNVMKLIFSRMAAIAVPAGGGIGDALNFVASKERIVEAAREAEAWVASVVKLVRSSPCGRWKASTDEQIAAEILRQAEERKAKP